MDPVLFLQNALQLLPYGGMLFTILMFIVVLAVLVFVHEYGHFYAARSVGVFVEKFSIGFGPVIQKWDDVKGTRWQVAWLPLGGFVQMRGQEDGKAMAADDDPESFAAKSVKERAWIIFAGPLANFLLAMVLLMGLMMYGEEQLKPVIGQVQEDMPAAAAGLQEGDVIRLVNDTPITDWDTMRDVIQQNLDAELQLVVERGNELLPILLSPDVVEYTDLMGRTHTVGRVGVLPSGATFYQDHGLLGGMVRGVEKTWELIALTFESIYRLIMGAISPDNLAGPLGIAQLTGSAADQGVYALLLFMAIISINLGIVNLLPIPVLDGGHLLFLLWEALFKQPPSEKVQTWSIRAGMAIILLLVVFATSNDIQRFLGN